MGTSPDMLELLGGDPDRLAELERGVARRLGLRAGPHQRRPGLPRSLDFDVVSALVQLVSGPCNLAATLRLMAGHDLVTEGFAEGQVGSGNAPQGERPVLRAGRGLAVVLGATCPWSAAGGRPLERGRRLLLVVRRIALPGAFLATDGLFGTFLTVLNEFAAFPAVIQRELDRYLPFLATTKVLMAAIRNGVGREAAHQAIKEAAVGAALDLRAGAADNDVVDRLVADGRLGLTRAADIDGLMAEPLCRSPAPPSPRRRPSYAGWPTWWPPTPTPRRTTPAGSSSESLPAAAPARRAAAQDRTGR